ncbi:MAG: ligand-binding protein SH3 [Rhodospirillales bacterium]|nr:ligand-binding protein SH3 [Rhodospirillales bacterium]
MSSLIKDFTGSNGVVTVNRVILKPEYTVDDLQERVAMLCENVKTYHSDTGFKGGFVMLNSGSISNEGSTVGQAVESPMKDKEALIVTFWDSFEQHEESHKSKTFQPLFKDVLELCENGNEEIAYTMLWQGAAYSPEEAKAAQEAKAKYAQPSSPGGGPA